MRNIPYMWQVNQGLDENYRQINGLDDLNSLKEKILKENESIIGDILAARKFDNIPEVGEFLILRDGSRVRFTVESKSRESFQVASEGQSGFFLFPDGKCEQSGTCGMDIVNVKELKHDGEMIDGSVWMFDRNYRRAHNRLDFKFPFRVWHFRDDE